MEYPVVEVLDTPALGLWAFAGVTGEDSKQLIFYILGKQGPKTFAGIARGFRFLPDNVYRAAVRAGADPEDIMTNPKSPSRKWLARLLVYHNIIAPLQFTWKNRDDDNTVLNAVKVIPQTRMDCYRAFCRDTQLRARMLPYLLASELPKVNLFRICKRRPAFKIAPLFYTDFTLPF